MERLQLPILSRRSHSSLSMLSTSRHYASGPEISIWSGKPVDCELSVGGKSRCSSSFPSRSRRSEQKNDKVFPLEDSKGKLILVDTMETIALSTFDKEKENLVDQPVHLGLQLELGLIVYHKNSLSGVPEISIWSGDSVDCKLSVRGKSRCNSSFPNCSRRSEQKTDEVFPLEDSKGKLILVDTMGTVGLSTFDKEKENLVDQSVHLGIQLEPGLIVYHKNSLSGGPEIRIWSGKPVDCELSVGGKSRCSSSFPSSCRRSEQITYKVFPLDDSKGKLILVDTMGTIGLSTFDKEKDNLVDHPVHLGIQLEPGLIVYHKNSLSGGPEISIWNGKPVDYKLSVVGKSRCSSNFPSSSRHSEQKIDKVFLLEDGNGKKERRMLIASLKM